jgi:hypothetical protein
MDYVRNTSQVLAVRARHKRPASQITSAGIKTNASKALFSDLNPHKLNPPIMSTTTVPRRRFRAALGKLEVNHGGMRSAQRVVSRRIVSLLGSAAR